MRVCPIKADVTVFRRVRVVLGLGAGGWLLCAAGCAHYETAPLVVDRAAAGLEARTLDNAELRRYLAANLGRDFSAVTTEWDFEALVWVAFYYNPSLAVARRAALQARADVLVALARFEASQMALEQEVTKRNSAVHLGPGYQWDQGANKWTLALTLELPLFHRNEGPITEAVARRQEAAAVFNATQAQALAEIDGAVARRRAAVAQVVSVRQMQSQLERQTALVQARLQAGGADRSDLATAQLEQAAGDLALVEAQAVAAGAAGDLEAALQVPFGNFAALAPVTSKP